MLSVLESCLFVCLKKNECVHLLFVEILFDAYVLRDLWPKAGLLLTILRYVIQLSLGWFRIGAAVLGYR